MFLVKACILEQICFEVETSIKGDEISAFLFIQWWSMPFKAKIIKRILYFTSLALLLNYLKPFGSVKCM